MAQVFKINSTTLTYINDAQWGNELGGPGLDGLSPKSRWVTHTWQAEAMTVAEYNTLFALEGQKVSITTTDYENRNGDFKTYYNVDFEEIEGSQPGLNFENVSSQFKVRL